MYNGISLILVREYERGIQKMKTEDEFKIRALSPEEGEAINELSLRAYDEYRDGFPDWHAFKANIGRMASLQEIGTIYAAESHGAIIGAVCLVPPGGPRRPEFDPKWAILRMLSVDPAHRGKGIGRALTQYCINLSRLNGWNQIALHTSPIMTVALLLYTRMGFVKHCDIPPISGAPYAIYLKELPGIESAPDGYEGGLMKSRGERI
jgi:GNAT superfamily N-acetyltransferase